MDEREAGDGEETNKEKGAAAQPAKFDWKANEVCLAELISLGIDRETARKALYHTTNDSIEKAFDWIFSQNNAADLAKTSLEEDLGFEQINDLFPAITLEDYKMVFVINTSLGMSLGKCCSQTAHAVLAIVNDNIIKDRFVSAYHQWIMNGGTKIVLAGESTKQLDALKEKADALSLPNQIIRDAGRTEIEPGSKTVLVVFGSVEEVDKVTGGLRLLK